MMWMGWGSCFFKWLGCANQTWEVYSSI